MIVAIPTLMNELCTELTQCKTLVLYVIENNRVEGEKHLDVPVKDLTQYPAWLKQLKVNLLISGTIDQELKELFKKHHIETITGVPRADTRMLVDFYIIKNPRDNSLSP